MSTATRLESNLAARAASFPRGFKPVYPLSNDILPAPLSCAARLLQRALPFSEDHPRSGRLRQPGQRCRRKGRKS